MGEEKKELENSEEDEKTLEEKELEEKKSEEEGSEEEEKEEKEEKEDFKKEDEIVSASKYNQLLRQRREADVRERDLSKELEEARAAKAPAEKEEEGDDDEDDEDFFKKKEEDKKGPDTSKIIDEKLKPITEAIKKRDESDKKLQRKAFFDANPEYLDSEKFQELLDELDKSINPASTDDYYTQLDKARRIVEGDSYDPNLENKKKELAKDAASGGDGAEKGGANEEFTPEDKKYMEDFEVSEEGMRAYKQKIESGDMQILN